MTSLHGLRLLVTRPAPQAEAWVQRLGERGLEAAALPLIAIEGASDTATVNALQVAWRGLPERALVVFVSPNAVTQFFAQRPPGCNWPDSVPAGSPGPGSSAALREAGLSEAAIIKPAATAPRFDSEALWAVLAAQRDWRGASVLVVRGGDEGDGPRGHGREWLAETLRAAGAQVDFVRAYSRSPPRLDAAQQALLHEALAAPAAHCWLFSSSEALAQLQGLLHTQGLAGDWQAAQALATHPRIAANARAAGFGRVIEAAPTLDAIVAALHGDSQGRSIESGAP